MHSARLRRWSGSVVAGGALALVVSACSGSDSQSKSTQLTVFAAASLSDAFSEIEKGFEADHPEVDVVYSFVGSNVAATQVSDGAPADVLATADETSMERVVESGEVKEPSTFATNTMEMIVAPGNPHRIESLADLSNSELTVVLCHPDVPCGQYSQAVLDHAGVDVSPVSLEANVNGVVTKVVNGEADAGLVYTTNIAAVGPLAEGVEVSAADNITADYQIATVGSDPSPGASAFVEYVSGGAGQAVLTEYGFGPP